jgi:RND family efflux transporter MFP subunit
MCSRIQAGRCLTVLAALFAIGILASCGEKVSAKGPENSGVNTQRVPEVGVIQVARTNLARMLVVSSELVPFQQIDVYAKESGFVRQLSVDYGTHVKEGQVMAVLEIPELEMQIQEDAAAIKDAASEVTRFQNEVSRVEAQHKVSHLQYSRLDQVAQLKNGLVAQQEVDDWRGKDLAAESQVAAAQSTLQAAQSQLDRAKAKERHDQILFDYAKITAPFTGVVTKRYANKGTLMQSGMNSSTQALPLVQLSEDDLFRLVIPVPESYVPDIHVGDPVQVRVASLNRTFPGKVTRFSVDVEEDTRTMHTEVDVPNPQRLLMPGMFAEATLTLNRNNRVLVVPPEAVNIKGDDRSVWVVSPSHKVEERPVSIGMETPDDEEIVSGLKEGELVAVGDRSRLRGGETVQPKLIQLERYDPAKQPGN